MSKITVEMLKEFLTKNDTVETMLPVLKYVSCSYTTWKNSFSNTILKDLYQYTKLSPTSLKYLLDNNVNTDQVDNDNAVQFLIAYPEYFDKFYTTDARKEYFAVFFSSGFGTVSIILKDLSVYNKLDKENFKLKITAYCSLVERILQLQLNDPIVYTIANDFLKYDKLTRAYITLCGIWSADQLALYYDRPFNVPQSLIEILLSDVAPHELLQALCYPNLQQYSTVPSNAKLLTIAFKRFPDFELFKNAYYSIK